MRALFRWSVLLFTCATVASTGGAQGLPRHRLVAEMRIDGAREEFARIRGFLVARDGRIIVPLEQERMIAVYSADGRRLLQFGRAGSGPGEFQNLGRIGWVGDTLWVYDGIQRRLTWFSGTGEVLRSQIISPASGPLGDVIGPLAPFAVHSGGRFSANGGERNAGPGEGRSFRVIATGASEIQRIVSETPGTNGSVYVRDAGRVNVWGVPFFSHSFDAAASDGSRLASVATTHGPGPNASYRITVWNRAGDSLFSRSYAFIGERVADRSRDSAMATLESRRSQSAADAEMHRQVNAQVPVIHRHIESFRLGEDETIWLQLRSSGDNLYRMLDGRGNSVAEITLPPRTDLVRASRTQVWAVERDADDVPSIVRYRIQPPG